MIRQLAIQNFKAFSSKQVVPCSDITLIFGANSAGKSSILQTLLALHQTLTRTEAAELDILLSTDLVDLGTFANVIHDHKTDENFEIAFLIEGKRDGNSGVGFEFTSGNKKGTFAKLASIHGYYGDLFVPTFTLAKKAVPRNRFPGKVNVFGVSTINASHAVWRERFLLTQRYWEDHKVVFDATINRAVTRATYETIVNFQKQVHEYDLDTYIAHVNELNTGEAVRLFRFLAQSPTMIGDRSALDSALNRALRGISESPAPRQVLRELYPDALRIAFSSCSSVYNHIYNLAYIGPLRERPNRYYVTQPAPVRTVGPTGRLVVDMLNNSHQLTKMTNDFLEKLGVNYELRLQRFSSKGTGTGEVVASLRLVDKARNVTLGMPDVGFGVGQVLPVIVQSLLSKDQVIAIEQPELHLHPKMQAELAEVFVESAVGRGNQLFIETHSEHILLRLLKLVRLGRLDPRRLSVVFVDTGTEGAVVRPLRVDNQGQFVDVWPGGFFEEDYEEMFDS